MLAMSSFFRQKVQKVLKIIEKTQKIYKNVENYVSLKALEEGLIMCKFCTN